MSWSGYDFLGACKKLLQRVEVGLRVKKVDILFSCEYLCPEQPLIPSLCIV